VEVEVRIDVSGRVSAAHLETPNVKPQLASAAMAAARQWTFQPATLRGQRVETSHTIIFEFRPDGQ
jgi:TonB family protein